VNEEAAAQQYLLDLLTADATLSGMVTGVWLRSVPQSSPMPAVKIDRQDGSDVMVVGLARVWADMGFLVRGITHWRGGGQPDWTDARAIGDRIDALLHDQEGQNAEVAVMSYREEPFTDETIEGGDLFLHCGGIFRVRARAL
jgi:hypothetical protein